MQENDLRVPMLRSRLWMFIVLAGLLVVGGIGWVASRGMHRTDAPPSHAAATATVATPHALASVVRRHHRAVVARPVVIAKPLGAHHRAHAVRRVVATRHHRTHALRHHA